MIIGMDCQKRPLYVGDLVEWVYDEHVPKIHQTVLGQADRSNPLEGPEQGYLEIHAPGHEIQRRYGVNLRKVVDVDLVVDEGL